MAAPQSMKMVDEETFDNFKGGGGFKVNMKMFWQDDDVCCRYADCCCDSGCRKLNPSWSASTTALDAVLQF